MSKGTSISQSNAACTTRLTAINVGLGNDYGLADGIVPVLSAVEY